MDRLPDDVGSDRLTLGEAQQVLRYWLASVRLEEALGTRPQAHKAPPGDDIIPRLDAPARNRDYFKVPMRDIEALLRDGEPLVRRLDAELAAFVESWLMRRYKRRDGEEEVSHLLCVPVVHLPRDRLCGLLRAHLRLRFVKDDGQAFVPPTRVQRRRQHYPAPPVAVEIRLAARAAGEWPFFVDTRLLHDELGVTHEAIDALFEQLRRHQALDAPVMLAHVQRVLAAELLPDGAGGAPDSESELSSSVGLSAMLQAMQAVLSRRGRRARAYGFGIVVDADQARTTWHLQRDIRQLLEAEEPSSRKPPLAAYLTGRPLPSGRACQRALLAGRPPLTESQRAAADAFWGSALTAVQGPPGTGKTTLIQHLCAELVVRQVEGLIDRGELTPGPLVVASSNNRAVDNALEPLMLGISGMGEVLPLALRAGSRQVCEEVLASQLRRVALWLAGAMQRSERERALQLEQAVEAFGRLRDQVQAELADRADAHARESERNALREALAEIPALATDRPPPRDTQPLREACEGLRRRLVSLSQRCEGPATSRQLDLVLRHFKRTQRKALARFDQALAGAGRVLSLDLPPSLQPGWKPQVLLECWEDAVEIAIDKLDALSAQLLAEDKAQAQAVRRARLQARLEALGQPASVPRCMLAAEMQEALFVSATRVREAWAGAHAEALAPLVEQLLSAASEGRTLYQAFRDAPADWLQLMRLFGVWGCTLLSMGNCFPAQPGAIARLIIDEAGQCHPVHGVSGLLRSRAALVIGDVNQLTPIFELGREEDQRALQSSRVDIARERLAFYRLHSDAETSVQALADRAVRERLQLTDHFRCQPPIIRLCDSLCSYGLHVHTPDESRQTDAAWLRGPLLWLDPGGQQERLGGSWCNMAEADAAQTLVGALLDAGIPVQDVAVITPYRGQLERLRRAFVQRGVPLERSPELSELDSGRRAAGQGLALGTVHRFQGGERSVVVFSCVVTRQGSLPFLNSRKNLLNVAISRARHHLVCLGSRAVLGQGSLTRILADAAAPLQWDSATPTPPLHRP